MSDIDPQDFGALSAEVRILTKEVHGLRQEMAQINALINQGRGGIYVLVLAAGAMGSVFTLLIRKVFG